MTVIANTVRAAVVTEAPPAMINDSCGSGRGGGGDNDDNDNHNIITIVAVVVAVAIVAACRSTKGEGCVIFRRGGVVKGGV